MELLDWINYLEVGKRYFGIGGIDRIGYPIFALETSLMKLLTYLLSSL